MQRAVVVRGQLRGTHIDLAEPIDQFDGEVEVTVRPVPSVPTEDVFAFLRSLPPGGRTKEDIDRQLAHERDSWGDR